MKILKKGNYLRAYATKKNENATRFQIGNEMGYINIKTKKFVGATACMVELHNALKNTATNKTKHNESNI
jgi:hypothetical protein